jgi:hypothetical protein
MHVLYEMTSWLNLHVKNKDLRDLCVGLPSDSCAVG